jgi:proteasome accessory factor B
MPELSESDRAGRTRAPMQRIYHIHQAVAEERLPNCSVLARELEVTPKTIQRDITFMRDRLQLPLVYDDQRHGYRYTKDVSAFPVFEANAEELAGLFLARQALDSIRGTQLEQTMREVFAKLTRAIEGKVKFAWSDLDKALSRKPVGVAKTNLKLFGKLAEAVLHRREVEFTYRKLGSDRSEKRRIQPYHLGEVDHCWYLIGHDLQRGKRRTFALPRIRAAKVRKENFEVPEDFDGASYLGTSFGIWVDPDRPDFRQEVRIELSGYAARLGQERRWHPSQQVTPLNATGSRIEVRFEVGRLEELVRWTLSWGGQAKVLEPNELRERVQAEAAKIQGH